MVSSFSGFDDDEEEDDDGVITVGNQGNVITYKGDRYRKFVNDSQISINHYLLDLRGVPKVHIKGNWFYKIVNHKCRIHCIDSGDTTTPLGYEWGTKPDGEFGLL